MGGYGESTLISHAIINMNFLSPVRGDVNIRSIAQDISHFD